MYRFFCLPLFLFRERVAGSCTNSRHRLANIHSISKSLHFPAPVALALSDHSYQSYGISITLQSNNPCSDVACEYVSREKLFMCQTPVLRVPLTNCMVYLAGARRKQEAAKKNKDAKWLSGTITAIKLPRRFGFIRPDAPLPKPFLDKDVHFNFETYEPPVETPPEVGELIEFILRRGSDKKPTAFKVRPSNASCDQVPRTNPLLEGVQERAEHLAEPGSNVRTEVTKPKLFAAHRAEGRIVSIRHNVGFIKPDLPLPSDYHQAKNIFFDVGRAQAGHLHLVAGDRVSFSLGTKDTRKPRAFSVKLVKCNPRNTKSLEEFIDGVALKLKQIKEEGGRSRVHSEYLIELISCKVTWDCVGNSTTLTYRIVQKLLQLFIDLESQSRSMLTTFSKALQVIAHTSFLNPFKGPLHDFVATCFQRQDQAAMLILQQFLLILMQYVPEKTRAVVSLVKPLVNGEKSTPEYFLYSLLKRAAKFSVSHVEDMEWDDLPLVPTASELLCGPQTSERDLRRVKEKGPYESAQDYLDIYIRLLRADCFEALKKGLSDFLNGKLDPRDMNVYHSLHLVGIQLTRQDSGLTVGLKVTPLRQVRNWNTCSNLMFGNLLCISPAASFQDPIWAMVVSRDALPKHQIVVAELCTERNSVSDSEALLLLESMNGHTIMVESPTYYRAYQPVLTALQKVDSECISFHEELVQVKSEALLPQFLQDNPEATIDAGLIYKGLGYTNVLEMALRKAPIDTSLDKSQEAAIKQALLNRLAIIQGPPGTGKTFVGVKLVQLLLSMDCVPAAPILLLTYKNHALDEFLKGLLHVGITDIVRVGGRCQDAELERKNLNEIKKTRKVSGELFKHIREYRAELNELKYKVECAFERLDNARSLRRGVLSRSLNSEQLTSLLLGCDWDKSQLTSFKLTEKGKDVQVCKEQVKALLDSLEVPLADFLQLSADSPKKTNIQKLVQEATRQWAPSAPVIRKVEAEMKSHMQRVNTALLFAPIKMTGETSPEELFSEKDIEEEQRERMAALGYQQMKRSEELMKDFKFMRKVEHDHSLFGVTRGGSDAYTDEDFDEC